METKKTRKPRKKKLEPQTLQEFKAWISGVEEMQPSDWIPSEEQWLLIRERIKKIYEEEYEATDAQPFVPQHPIPRAQPMPQQIPSSLMAPQIPSTIPAEASSLSVGARELFKGAVVTGDTHQSSGLAEMPKGEDGGSTFE
jgi:hypothetical protein